MAGRSVADSNYDCQPLKVSAGDKMLHHSHGRRCPTFGADCMRLMTDATSVRFAAVQPAEAGRGGVQAATGLQLDGAAVAAGAHAVRGRLSPLATSKAALHQTR